MPETKWLATLFVWFVSCVGEVANHVSPSQIEKFRDWSVKGRDAGCKGKWGFSYLDKIAKIAHANTDTGTAVHSALEGWLLRREMPQGKSLIELCTEAIILNEAIPDPSTPGLNVEGEIKFRLAGFEDCDIIGKCDYRVLEPQSVRMLTGRIVDKCIIIGDFKTIGNIKYKKTESELRGTSDVDPGDPQVAVYGLAMLDFLRCNPEVFARTRHIMFRWHYVEKKAPYKTETVEFVLDLHNQKDVLTAMDLWHITLVFDVRPMVALKRQSREIDELEVKYDQLKTPLLIAPSDLSPGKPCRAFNGCQHARICHKIVKISFDGPTEAELRARQEKFPMPESVSDKIARIRAEEAAKAAEGASKPPATTTTTTSSGEPQGAAAKLAAKKAADAAAAKGEKAPETKVEEKPKEVEKAAVVEEKPKEVEEKKPTKAAAKVPSPVSVDVTLVTDLDSKQLLVLAGLASLREGRYAVSASVSMVLNTF